MTTETLGERIRAARQAAGLSQEKLAERLGLTRQAVTKWETGQSAPSTENLLHLAEVLGVPVTALLDVSAPEQQMQADKIYALQKAQTHQGAAEILHAFLCNLRTAFIILACWIAVYLLGRLVCGDIANSSLLGWLFGTDSKYYLFGWLLTSGLYWASMLVSVLPALFHKWRFAALTFVVSASAIPIGEILGPNPANAPYGHGHDGWLIWICLNLVAFVSGIVLERMAKKGVRLRSKKGAVWAAATALACIAVIVLILCTRPVMTGS